MNNSLSLCNLSYHVMYGQIALFRLIYSGPYVTVGVPITNSTVPINSTGSIAVEWDAIWARDAAICQKRLHWNHWDSGRKKNPGKIKFKATG